LSSGSLWVIAAVFLFFAFVVHMYDNYRIKRKLEKLMVTGVERSEALELSKLGRRMSTKLKKVGSRWSMTNLEHGLDQVDELHEIEASSKETK
jgi:hypothetical protein